MKKPSRSAEARPASNKNSASPRAVKQNSSDSKRVTDLRFKDAKPAHTSDLHNNLSSQTPLNRKLKQKNAPAEPGTVRRTKAQHFKIKQEKPKKTKNKPKTNSVIKNRITLVLMCYAVMMPIALGVFWLWLPRHTTPETQDYTYQIGPDDDILSRKIFPWETVREGNTYYVDMTGIAELCDMTTTGDAKSVKYTVRANNESVEFVFGESVATINGVVDRMDGNAYFRNGRVYVPLTFVDRCFNGVSASVDTSKNKITVIREVDAEGDYLTVSFPYKNTVLSESIDFYTLDKEIIDEILFREEASKPPVTDGDE